MTTPHRHPLAALGREIRRAQNSELQARRRPTASEQLVAIRAKRHGATLRDRAQGKRAGLLLAAAAIMLLIGAAVALRTPGPSPLAFHVGSAATPGQLGDRIAADQDTMVRFSDGSSLEVRRAGMLRVARVSTRGAHVLLEGGVVETHVVPRAGNDWVLSAGPFEVFVTGTRFETEWKPETGALRVTMREGRVRISAPCLPHPREVSGTERLELHCDSGHARDTSPERPVATASAATAPAPSAPSVEARTPMAPSASAVRALASSAQPTSEPWQKAIVGLPPLDAMRLVPVEEVLASGPAADVLKLGDLARRAGQTGVAERAYRKLLREGGDMRGLAMFMLARLLLDTGRSGEGIALLETYDRENPAGPFAEAALGRRLEMLRHAKSPVSVALAESYLQRFPKGPHATTARNMLTQ